MYRYLKIVVPAIQVLVVFALGLDRLFHNVRFLEYYIYPFKEVMTFVNLPVVIVWTLIGFALECVKGRTAGPSEWVFVAETTLVPLFIASVGLFWYFVIAEIELRSRGKSMLRFSGWFGELFAVATFCMGAVGLFFAYQYSRSVWNYRRLQGITGAIVLAIWGIVFVAIAVSDLMRSHRKA